MSDDPRTLLLEALWKDEKFRTQTVKAVARIFPNTRWWAADYNRGVNAERAQIRAEIVKILGSSRRETT